MSNEYDDLYEFKEKIQSLGVKIDSNLISHPSFYRIFNSEIKEITKNIGCDKYCISTSCDGKIVTISSDYPLVRGASLTFNQNYISVEISIDSNKWLTVDRSMGTFYDCNDLIRSAYNFDSNNYPFFLEMRFSQNNYDPCGIEMGKSFYIDRFLTTNDYSNNKLRDFVLISASPTFGYFKNPNMPNVAVNASFETFFRGYDNLGMVNHTVVNGLNSNSKSYINVTYDIQVLDCEYPERLFTNCILAVWDNKSRKYILDSSIFKDTDSYVDIFNYCLNAFGFGIEMSKTKQHDADVFKYLKKIFNKEK